MTEKEYYKLIDNQGLVAAWNDVLSIFMMNTQDSLISDSNIGMLYEMGLAHVDKISKKELGKYFTPDDVAQVMAQYLLELHPLILCDVGCGTGNLIMSVLGLMTAKQISQIVQSGAIYLYDIDPLALDIAKHRITKKYGAQINHIIHIVAHDFLDNSVNLPRNATVISNPPYGRMQNITNTWCKNTVIADIKELYIHFMYKIFIQSDKSVIITPNTFLHANMYKKFRIHMSNYAGTIFTFDNVPGSVFSGKKHGIFNTNNTNSVRAAVTITNKDEIKGYKVSPIIRFKNTERQIVFNINYLNSLLSPHKQVVDNSHSIFWKIPKDMYQMTTKWFNTADKKLSDLMTLRNSGFNLYVPNTCRYYTVASPNRLQRAGQICLMFNNQNDMLHAYALFNSSFAYYFYRIYDGGITFTKTAMMGLPIIPIDYNNKIWQDIVSVCLEMMNIEKQHQIFKKNAGIMQENIKFPDQYREKLNLLLVKLYSLNINSQNFNAMHNNNIFNLD